MKLLLKVCLILSLNIIVNNTYCTSIDSLKQVLNKAEINTIKVSCSIQLSKLYKNKTLDSAAYFAHKAYHISEKINFRKGKIRSGINLAGIYLRSYPDSSLHYIAKIFPLIEPHEYRFLSKAYINKGVASAYVGNEVEAMQYYQTATKYAKQTNNMLMLTKLYNNMGNLVATQNQAKAKNYYKKGLITAEKAKSTGLKGHILINLGGMYFGEGNYDTAKIMLEKALVIKKMEEDLTTQSIIYANLGRIYNQRAAYDSAIIVLKKGLEISKALNFSYSLQHNLQVLQSAYFYKKAYQKSIFYGQAVLEQNADNKDFSLLVDVNDMLAKAAAGKGNYKMAFDFQKASKIMADSLNNRAQNEKIAQLEAAFQSKEQAQKIMLLEQEKKTEQANNKALWIGVLLTFGLFIIALIGYRQKQLYSQRLRRAVHRQTKDLKKKNEQLIKANNDLNQFNYIASHDIKEPIRVVAGYVKLIHKNISDENKIALKGYFDTIDKGIKQLYTLIEDIAKYMQYNQDIIVEYAPTNLNEIIQNIEVNLKQIIENKNGKIIFETLPIINSNASIIYVALKNIIQNGLKYNKSEQPTVSISHEETTNSMILKIEDNGIGIDSKYHSKVFQMFKRLHNKEEFGGTGLGLSITKTVIEKIGGTIRIDSKAKTGTTFIITLPK